MNPPYKREEDPPGPDDHGDIVTIAIPSGRKFGAHAHLLAHYSDYFQCALSSQFKEASTLHFNLSEHATEGTLSMFIRWLYSRSYVESFNLGSIDVMSRFSAYKDKELVEAWLFGDYIQAKGFRDDVIRLMDHKDFYYGCVPEVWNLTPANTKLRTFLLDAYCRGIRKLHDQEVLD
ncbi:hypothetical protein F4779DRAFT_634927 [Xylariaceae sp. FL0662B]|nr:hypothetical protein F4779DRAFT_634927 [Xylariaceae sp. FL0662B]